MKKLQTILFFLFLISYKSAFTQTNEGNNKLFLDCYIIESNLDPGKYLQQIDNTGFVHYDFKKIPNMKPLNNRMITIRSTFKTSDLPSKISCFLVIQPVEYPFKIFFNGHLIQSFGEFENGYKSRNIYTKAVLLPKEFFNSLTNNIVFEIYPLQGEEASFGRPFLTDNTTSRQYAFTANALGISFVRTIAIFSILIAFYFLFQFILSSEKKQHLLYFAFFNFAVSFSYFNNVFTPDTFDTYIVEKITRTAYIFFGSTLTAFFLAFTQKMKALRFVNYSALVMFIFAMFQNDLHSVMWFFDNITGPYLLVMNLIILLVIFKHAIRVKNSTSILFLITYLINLSLGFRDLYYFSFIHERPYVLLTSYVNFTFILVIFWALAKEHSDNYKLLKLQKIELETIRENLEKTVKVRTADLTTTVDRLNEEILLHKRTQQKLNENIATKDKFFSIISHDLKSPFNTLIGFSEMLIEQFEDYERDKIKDFVNHIRESAVKTHKLLKNLLIWSQSQTGHMNFEPKQIDLKQIIENNIELIKSGINLKKVSVATNLSKINTAYADFNMIDTVVRNLLDNAIKYTPTEGNILIKTENPNGLLKISIHDSGVGISSEDIQKLFKIDEKVVNPGTNNEKGAGLGLILCREFVEKNSGTISVSSMPGKGSSFSFTLPSSKNRESDRTIVDFN